MVRLTIRIVRYVKKEESRYMRLFFFFVCRNGRFEKKSLIISAGR